MRWKTARPHLLTAVLVGATLLVGCGDECLCRIFPKVVLEVDESEGALSCVDDEDSTMFCTLLVDDTGGGPTPPDDEDADLVHLVIGNPTIVPLSVTSLHVASIETSMVELLVVDHVADAADGPVTVAPGDITRESPISILGDPVLDEDAAGARTTLTMRFPETGDDDAQAILLISSDAINVHGATDTDEGVADLPVFIRRRPPQ
jgi:hypothetical protein